MPTLIKRPAAASVYGLVTRFNIPRCMIPEMLCDINTGLKTFKLISQRNFLTQCRRLKVCPPEIKNLASRINSDRTKQTNYKYEDNIMKYIFRCNARAQ